MSASPGTPATSGAPSIEEVLDEVKRRFCGGREARFEFDEQRPPESMLGGRLVRVGMITADANASARTVAVFPNAGSAVGKHLWAHEVRALLRLGGIGNAALPEIHDGGWEEVSDTGRVRDLAYVVTGGADGTLGDPAMRAALRQDRPLFVRRLFQLVDALVALHRDGFLHRNIHPGTIEYVITPEGSPQLRLSRFEMTSLLSDYLRRRIEGSEAAARAAREAFVAQGPAVLATVAPERLRYLFGGDASDGIPEHVAGDVYSLGVAAFQCLVDELDPVQLAAVFPTPSEEAPGFHWNADAWLGLNRWMCERVAGAGLGPALTGLLLQMLEPDFGTRLRSPDLLAKLTAIDLQILEELSPSDDAPQRLVAIEPAEAISLQRWGWISEQPLTTEDGRNELLDFLREDLGDAWLEYAPGELERHVLRTERREDMRKAKYVLRGRVGFYYGHLYENRQSSNPPVFAHTFMIRWVLRREAVSKETGGRVGPRIGASVKPLKIVARQSPDTTNAKKGYPSWEELFARVSSGTKNSSDRDELVGALRWLLRYQRAVVEGRRYPYLREDASVGRQPGQAQIRLRYDADRDHRWMGRDPIRNLYGLKPVRRPSFGDFFGARGDRDSDERVRWWPDMDGAPNRDRRLSGVGSVVLRATEPDCITITLENPAMAEVPMVGWIEPADDEGQSAAFDRQAEAALRDLFDHPSLAARLLRPWSFLDSADHWRDAAEGLIGETTPAALRRMIAADPIYVLQGPPGTGKTTVVSRAVRAAIANDPSIRILVAAQSHYALDNLALAILEPLGEDHNILAIRLASTDTELSVDERVRGWTRGALMESRPQKVKQLVDEYLSTQGLDPEEREIIARWRDTIDSAHPDILDRTFAGANIVFATCLHSAESGVVVPGQPHRFDWVVVEEAAKALPSELVIPLVRGGRWTLVGDHKQLPPYGLREMGEFLNECVNELRFDQSASLLLDGADRFSPFFNLFGRFFERQPEKRPAPSMVGVDKYPVDALDLQFRMAPEIGDVVRDAFYAGALKHGRERGGAPSTARIPRWFGGKRLVWLNTDDERTGAGDGGSAAIEAAMVRQIVAELWPGSAPKPGELAILTGYRRQRSLLQDTLPSAYKSLVHTVDSFQGREAEVVIVSLVRGYPRVPQTTVYQRIGHLAEPARTNVMLSRAREYMVIVGQFRHFHDSGRMMKPDEPGAFWATICKHFRDGGCVRSSLEQYPDHPRGVA